MSFNTGQPHAAFRRVKSHVCRGAETLRCDFNARSCARNHTSKGEDQGRMVLMQTKQREMERERQKKKKVLCGLYVQPAVIPCKALLLSLTWHILLPVLHLLLVLLPWHQAKTIHTPRATVGKGVRGIKWKEFSVLRQERTKKTTTTTHLFLSFFDGAFYGFLSHRFGPFISKNKTKISAVHFMYLLNSKPWTWGMKATRSSG